MQCPKCSEEVAAGNKFCNECGTKMPEPAKASSGEGVHLEGSAQVLGDAIGGDKTEVKTQGGDAHIDQSVSNVDQSTTNIDQSTTVHQHTDQTKEVKECGVCGLQKEIVGFHNCPSCHQPTCEACYDIDQRMCSKCLSQARFFDQFSVVLKRSWLTFFRLLLCGTADEEDDHVEQHEGADEVKPNAFFHYGDLVATHNLSLVHFSRPPLYLSRHAGSRTDATATIFWTCIKIAKALNEEE